VDAATTSRGRRAVTAGCEAEACMAETAGCGAEACMAETFDPEGGLPCRFVVPPIGPPPAVAIIVRMLLLAVIGCRRGDTQWAR
jgi:hypothetical protein